MPIWIKEKLLQKRHLIRSLDRLERGSCTEEKLKFGFHHHSHAASAFYPSPFESAAILVADGVGEWATTTIGRGRGDEIELIRELRFPHSLGMLYAAFTYYLGFKVNDGEYKVMGLAPYGEPKYTQRIYDELVDLKDDGSFGLNMKYFNYCTATTMTNQRFDELFDGVPRREPELPLEQVHMDVARSIQAVTEEIMLRLCRFAKSETGERNLCLAGGVALNCVANAKIQRAGIFDDLWVQPASGDAGGALGVAYAISHTIGGVPRQVQSPDVMNGSYLGPRFDSARIRADLDRYDAVYHELGDDELFATVASALADEQVVGWFQGRMEFGPRALGNRSILADPRSPNMQRVLNLMIKYRESFRPFAPAVLRDRVNDYFDVDCDSPYMLLVAHVKPERRCELPPESRDLTGLDRLGVVRSEIPTVTHVDQTARIQTVHEDTNPRFHRLIREFADVTGCPILVNTSFNVRDEPIVCTPEDAYRCFMGTEMDLLVLDNVLLRKAEQ